MRKIKYIFGMLNIYWDVKRIVQPLILMTLLLPFLIFISGDVALPIAMISTVWLISIVVITISWFTHIRPAIKEAEKEIELEKKYEFFLQRFMKDS